MSNEKSEIFTKDDYSTNLQRKNLEDLRKLNCSENANKEAVQHWINKDSKLEFMKF